MSAYIHGEPLKIDSGPHLFLDDHLVEDRWALARTVNPPHPHLGNPIIVAERPWEERPYRPQVFYDDAIGRYRMYYQCFSGTNYWERLGPSYFTCYAESDDGVIWEKPEWPDAPFGEHTATNVISVGGSAQIQAPYILSARGAPQDVSSSPLAPNSECAPASAYPNGAPYWMTYNNGGLRLAYSDDGIHWTPARDEQLFLYHSDTGNHVLWNDALGKWVLYMRPPMFAAGVHEGPGKRHYRRRTAVSLSDDLLTWSTPRTVLYPDELDPPDYDDTHVFKYGNQYIGIVTHIHQDQHGANDASLAVSRDGSSFERPLPRQVWLPRGRPGAFDAGCVSVCAPVARGGELWFYSTGFPEPQAVFEQDSAIGIYKLMADRFIALEAHEPDGRGTDGDFGYLLTKEFVWHGKRLSVNCRMHGGDRNTHGDLRAEVVTKPDDNDPAGRMGQTVPGRSIDDCDLIRSNSPHQVVRWNGDDDLSMLDGKAVYLRFRLRNGGLFSFTMES